MIFLLTFFLHIYAIDLQALHRELFLEYENGVPPANEIDVELTLQIFWLNSIDRFSKFSKMINL